MEVLIPLLLDDPLWELILWGMRIHNAVLIPLLLDDPLWDMCTYIALNYNNGS